MQPQKSFATYSAYKRMFEAMETVEINGQKKVQCSYEYQEIDEKFVPANSNMDKSVKATNSVIMRLIKIGKLHEFQAQMDEMESMGTIVPLTEAEV